MNKIMRGCLVAMLAVGVGACGVPGGQAGVNINICNSADTNGDCNQSGTNSNVAQTQVGGGEGSEVSPPSGIVEESPHDYPHPVILVMIKAGDCYEGEFDLTIKNNYPDILIDTESIFAVFGTLYYPTVTPTTLHGGESVTFRVAVGGQPPIVNDYSFERIEIQYEFANSSDMREKPLVYWQHIYMQSTSACTRVIDEAAYYKGIESTYPHVNRSWRAHQGSNPEVIYAAPNLVEAEINYLPDSVETEAEVVPSTPYISDNGE